MNSPQIQETLEIWRILKKWSQADLAAKLGVGQKTVSRIENGGYVSPDLEKKLRALGYKGPLGRNPGETAGNEIPTGLVSDVDQIEDAVRTLAARGHKPPNPQGAHEMRRLVAQMLEGSRGSPESLADRVERVIQMAKAIRK